MNWNKHLSLEGKHAILSPSQYHWSMDDDDNFMKRMCSKYYAELGTLLHDEARKHIQYRYRLNKNDKRSIIVNVLDNGIPDIVLNSVDFDSIYDNMMSYVNDAISYRMSPEVVLYYSENCFGTTDAILYNEKNRELRIHDLKTGSTPAKMEQLYIYAALFFLEYTYVKPGETHIELRIYQNNDIVIDEPETDVIVPLMDKIKHLDEMLSKMRSDSHVL